MFEALEKARESGSTRKFEKGDNPRCPHCGETYDIHYHETWELYDPNENPHEIECGECEKEFTVSVRTSFSFSTDDADEFA